MTADKYSRLFTRGVAEVIRREELERLLDAGRPLRLKMGFDPSRADIHLGHTVGLRKLRQFQELGHRVILIVGDWTAQIGDPSGQSATRQMLSAEQVRENARSYMDQFFKVVDRDRTDIRWQSEWFGNFSLTEVISLTSRFTVAQLLAREDFSNRFKGNRPIAITELLYPLLQAYDSIVIEADVEFGGTDQKFNLLLGRELQSMMGQRPQQCLLVPILVGTDGVQRMSKSLDNYIGVAESPKDTYFKVMRLNDDLLSNYLELVTDLPDREISEMTEALASRSVNPMEIKKRLARDIVAQFHSPETAASAEAEFERIVQRKEADDLVTEVPVASLNSTGSAFIPRLLVEHKVTASTGEARRLIDGGGVEIGGDKLTEYTVEISRLRPGARMKVGKRRTLIFVDGARGFSPAGNRLKSNREEP